MARATFVKQAQRDYTADETGIPGGIKKGQSYYWWKFRYGGKRFSLTAPRPAQLTQSAFYGTLYDIQDTVAGYEADDSLASNVPDLISQLEELRDECQSSLDNMPEGLQQGSTGELLQERIYGLDNAISELEGIDLDAPEPEEFEEPEREEDESDEDYTARVAEEREQHEEEQSKAVTEHWENVLTEVQAVDLSIG